MEFNNRTEGSRLILNGTPPKEPPIRPPLGGLPRGKLTRESLEESGLLKGPSDRGVQ